MARYYIIHPNGDRFGPADTDTLRRWLDEGRLRLDWLTADEETGAQAPLSEVIPPIVHPEPSEGQAGNHDPSAPGSISSALDPADPSSDSSQGSFSRPDQNPIHSSSQSQSPQEGMPWHSQPQGGLPWDAPSQESQNQAQAPPSFNQAPMAQPPGYTQYPRGVSPLGDPGEVDSRRWYNYSVITGGLAVFVSLCACVYLALPFGLAAIVCGAIAKKSHQKAGIAGIILGAIGVILSIVLFIFLREALYSFADQFKQFTPPSK